MLRRIGLAALWFFAAWTAGAMAAFVLGLGPWVAPVAAISAAAGIFWALGHAARAEDVAGAQPGTSGIQA